MRLCDPCGAGFVPGGVDCSEVGHGCARGRCPPDPEDSAYYALALRLSGEHRSREPSDLQNALSISACTTNRHPEDKDEVPLRERVLDGLGRLPGLSPEEPGGFRTVRRTPERPAQGFRERLIYLESPRLGWLEVRLLLPAATPRPPPVVLGLHGHERDAAMFRDDVGAALASRGLAVAIPTLRAMAFDDRESDLAERFIEAGATLLGVRVAEALLVLHWLRGHEEVDSDRVGLLGHSGGSLVALLVARLHPIKALHFDLIDTFGWAGSHVTGDSAPRLQCSMDGVWVFKEINNTDTLGCPVRCADYDAWTSMGDAERAEIARFFLESL